MDLNQSKLTKSEWDSTETGVSPEELCILQMLVKGYDNINICENRTLSLFTYLKLDYGVAMEEFLYQKYFAPVIQPLGLECYTQTNAQIIRLKSADQIRLQNVKSDSIDIHNTRIYECVLLNHLQGMVKGLAPTNAPLANISVYRIYHYYTLGRLLRNQILLLNKCLYRLIEAALKEYEPQMTLLDAVTNSKLLIEQNPTLLKYADMKLYSHQKESINICKRPNPKLVLYNAPTGTGKTMTPLIISADGRRVIFVCAARHVGLALARAAISVGKKIAFAFGCKCAEDVRLHYAAAKVYTTDRRSGRIRKVDNSIGDLVEIMISDVGSYLYAMNYMIAFNPPTNIVTYWDEPTISMDYDDHPLHEIIHRNWTENLIPNIYLSSFTLPNARDIPNTTANFLGKFPDGSIYTIHHHESLKSIPLITPDGYVAMPHLMSDCYAELNNILLRCEETLTLMRYIDLQESVDVIVYIMQNNLIPEQDSDLARAFNSITDLDMTVIKRHYLRMLRCLDETEWIQVRDHFKQARVQRISTSTPGKCGVFVSTSDAHTLTDGPTLFLANDIKKIALFCIQQCNIPASIMDLIKSKIEFNGQIAERLAEWEKKLEDALEKAETTAINVSAKGGGSGKGSGGSKDSKRLNKQADKLVDASSNKVTAECQGNIDAAKRMIKVVKVDDIFIPNTREHLRKWANETRSRAFVSHIDDLTVTSIMQLSNVESYLKILLLIGIGVLIPHASVAYTEIVKQLADNQQLYLNLANGDYIYGTNYQHCHGYISKDAALSQEKIMQAIGRIGRHRLQQDYTVRFRDEEDIHTLFRRINAYDKPEVVNMNRLFGEE